MNTFPSIKILITTLGRSQKLLTEMFEKRETLSYRYEHALAMLDYEEEQLQYLVEYNVLRQNGDFIEIDDVFLDFFEQVLTPNEEINTALIDSNIQQVRENMNYYLSENNERRRNNYLKAVKQAFRKIGNITLRNVIKLNRTLTETYKTEPNLKVKKLKLETLDGKQQSISRFIEETYELLTSKEQTFYKTALDDELNQIIFYLKEQLNECKHNLIAIRAQIIEYLNQIAYQSIVVEKLRRIKYLKDQLTIRSDTDINAVLEQNNDVIFETKPRHSIKLSLDYLRAGDEVWDIIRKCALKFKDRAKVKQHLAGAIADEYLNSEMETETFVNLEEVRNSFLAAGKDLFSFVMGYDYNIPLGFDEKVTIYCQLICLYDDEFIITDNFAVKDYVEYALVYPK